MTVRNRANRLVDLGLACGLAAISFLVYRLTLAPSLSYASPDGNELATVPYVLGLAHSPGYPLYTWLGKAFSLLPFGDIAHRMNLMSAALAAISAGALYGILVSLLPQRSASRGMQRAAAALAALLFAFSPTLWSQATIAEVYAPNMALMAATLLALLMWERTRRDLAFFAFSLIYGLSLGTHLSDLGFAPAFAVFILLTDWRVLKRPTWWLAGLAGFGLGAAQFLWLPLKASTLNDRMMLERAPLTIKGIYNYTLGAFPQFKFAFSLSQLPDRAVVYLDLLTQQFGWLGILVGIVGLASLLMRRTRHYYLFVGVYLIQVWFFIQYRAFDLEVFFLPAHYCWAVFLGFGAVETLGGLEKALQGIVSGRRPRGESLRRAANPVALARGVESSPRDPRPAMWNASRWALGAAALSLPLMALIGNWEAADRSDDVAVNDFYANLWELLPADAALLTQSGVFGYDAFYWQLVYDTRPDVLLPALPTPQPAPSDFAGRALFSTTPMGQGGRGRGPGALPRDLLPPDLWEIPILISARGAGAGPSFGRPLALTSLSERPPKLVVDGAEPQIGLNLRFGDLTLVGLDLAPASVESGSRLHLVLYWRMDRLSRVQVTTALDGQTLETHELGFGNLARYMQEVGPPGEGLIVEDYWVVVPSTAQPGSYWLTLAVTGEADASELATVEVIDQEETMARWLRIAGKSD